MRIDGKWTNLRIDQSLAAIFVGANRCLGGGDAKLVVFVAKTDRVNKIKPAIVEGDFGPPKNAAEGWVWPNERIAGELPMEKIGRTENGKDLPDRMPRCFEFARAN